ncbi:hypothetical protein RchiOBHm_Chr1g0342091 [Rosa chinensis]|uniref:Uncharacterized protein n=1 Tax=Rosa chinensis TaxID=74649 RepID=A0A2P6SDX3_ROSCH|nr:hypothetical protein RchiOBHm_Chr1g0342091 [Rosa chinensis]
MKKEKLKNCVFFVICESLFFVFVFLSLKMPFNNYDEYIFQKLWLKRIIKLR